MNLGKIADSSTLNVSVIKGNTSISLSSTVAFTTEDVIYSYPFFLDGTMYKFEKTDTHVEMLVITPGEIPLFFKNVDISKEIYEGDIYHCVRTNVEGVKLNRRNSFRVTVGEIGSVMELIDGERIEATIRDISSTGIGFTTKKGIEAKFQSGSHVHIQFSDEAYRFGIDVTARVVRAEHTKDGIAYGCVFTRSYPQIDEYVNKKKASL